LALGGLSVLVVAPSTAGAATSPTASVISTAKNAKLGTILVSGTTVYALKPSKTACTAACSKVWSQVLLPHGITTATAGAGVDASKLGTVATAKGELQITYAGKRLYWFVKDKAPGQVHGNVKNKWGTWSAVRVTSSASSNDTNATATTPAPTTTVPSAPVQTAPPQTAAPDTAPPATSPPATQPTAPPTTRPSSPASPGTGGVGF
jgi:predicted lipoprotein with Yx(FWY)xxD motif